MLTKNHKNKIVLHDLDFEEKVSSSNLFLTVYGYVPCGTPNFIDDNVEGYLEIPKSMLGQGDFFVLRAKGDSMIDAGIKTGDLIIIKQQNYAEDGQVVVALTEEGNTLKRLIWDNGRPRLHAENKAYSVQKQDIYPKQLTIQGIALKVIKDIS